MVAGPRVLAEEMQRKDETDRVSQMLSRPGFLTGWTIMSEKEVLDGSEFSWLNQKWNESTFT